MFRSSAASAGLVLGTLGLLAPGSLAGERIDLRSQAFRRFAFELPGETWRRVGDAIELPGLGDARFPAELAGEGLRLDTDGDGALDRTLEGRLDEASGERRAFCVLERGLPDGRTLRYAVRLRDHGTGWQWSSSGALAGRIGDVRVLLFDQDGNGRFDDVGEDALLFGGGTIAHYLSEVVSVGGELLRLAVEPDGTALSLEPYTGPSGVLDVRSELETKGKLLAAIVQSEDERYSFDLARASGGLRVPAGTYRIVRGKLGLGKGFVRVIPGRANELVVAPGGETVLDWGGPVVAEFEYVRRGGLVQLDPNRVWYYGAAGEEYVGWTPIGKSPVFTIKERALGTELAEATFPGTS